MDTLSRVAAAAAVSMCAVGAVHAFPAVTEIRVAGEPTTQAVVVRREMALGVGDPADPERIAASRQALLDLGLFRDVTIETEPDGEGVALVVHLEEKRYLIAVPRVSTSSDRDYSYGVQARYSNLWGLDHMFDVRAERGRYPDDRLREEEQYARLRYSAPYAWGRTGLFLELEYVDRVAPLAGGGTFDERIDRAVVLFQHDLRDSRPRRGWIVTTGVQFRIQDAEGPLAPPREGRATAAVFGLDYSDLRFHVFSETGRYGWVRTELARDGWMSDYDYHRIEGQFTEHLALPGGDHHQLTFTLGGGVHVGGPRRVSAFGLGGSNALRGYELDHLEGDRYAYASVEWLRPVFGRDWLRAVVLAETGATGRSPVPGARSGGLYTNVGAGLRLRVVWFMNLEFELGVAYPLRGGDGLQVFGGTR